MRTLFITCVAMALGVFTSASPRAAELCGPPTPPPSCKPLPPAELFLRLLTSAPGQPVRFEATVMAHLPVEDLALDVQLPAGATWVSGLAGRLDANARRALPMAALLPAHGHAEIFATLHYRLTAGGTLTSGAHLSFDEGQPTQPPAARLGLWNGTQIREFSALGGGR